MKGKYVVFEGIDGSGKSTVCLNMAKKLQENGYKVLTITEPSSSEIGQLLRKHLKSTSVDPKVLALLFAADSYDIQTKFSEEYDYILSDRNYFSTIAYQMIEIDKCWLFELHRYLKNPDILFYLNVSVDKALERIRLREKNIDFFENRESLLKIKNNYDLLLSDISNLRIKIIDTDTYSVSEVENLVLSELYKIF